MASERPPDAFLSYTRFDDQHDGGAISQFRVRLANAVRAVTGEPFEIFQDVDGIGIGEYWPGKLDRMLDKVRFFIPILTPSYFTSKPCREELEKFLRAEAEGGRKDLVLPIYYIECDVLEEDDLRAADSLANILHHRQRQDWRDLRFETLEAREVRKELEYLATQIVRARRRSMLEVTVSKPGAEVQISAVRHEETPTAPPPPRALAVPPRADASVASTEVEYDGIKFRSPVEARWAVFFHTIELEYEYKTQGYDLNGAWYVPDFWLPKLGFWLEVRIGEPAVAEKDSCQRLADSSGRTVLMAIGAPEPRDQILMFSPSHSPRFPFQDERIRFFFADDRRNEGEFWLLSDAGAASSIGPQTGPDHGRYPGLYGATRRGYEASQSASFGANATAVPVPEHVAERRNQQATREQAKPAEAKMWAGSLPNPGTVFRDIDAPWCPELVVIPPGEFMMGSPIGDPDAYDDEKPQHAVRIAYHIAIGRYPVTFEEYDRFAEATRRERPSDNGWSRGRRPAINISWNDAKAFVGWLAAETGYGYRLLSEAEWEYACRAGNTTRYWWGDSFSSEKAHHYVGMVAQTSKVGTYPANPWGLYDMHGNVWEWVEDRWHVSYTGAPADGSAWVEKGSSRRRVVRGGAYGSTIPTLRAACRSKHDTYHRDSTIGVRVARELS